MKRPLTEHIPTHLQPFIAKQDASLYTPMDHASWRFILRVSKSFFKGNAHQKYRDGLKETGISSDRIPLIDDMDLCLRRFGWRAVPVSGFIPPAAFMEFQSLGILPIACEMRTLDHLAYTPAPDIVHEAAGHAPIIADPEYADYLRQYGEVSRKAIFSSKDMALYQAVRDLSDIKEDPRSTTEVINAAQRRLEETSSSVDYISEANLLARMNWWTVEYGLVGTMDEPKIYGAGLLSSVGESYHCLSNAVKRIPFTLDCINTSYDITRPQPQLFVTSDFTELSQVLEEFASTMAFRKGGLAGLAKAKMAGTVTTTVLDSGIQISGVVSDFMTQNGRPVFIKCSGPSQLGYQDLELEGQGAKYHAEGFSSPIGMLKNLSRSPVDLTDADLASLGFKSGQIGKLVFESGIEVHAELGAVTRRAGKNIILSLKNCTVKKGEQILFKPEWGNYDLACGTSVTSVFGGAADRGAFLHATGGFQQKPRNPKTNITPENQELNSFYAQVREIRESKKFDSEGLSQLKVIHQKLESNFPSDWLLRIELLELIQVFGAQLDFEQSLRARLTQISELAPDKAEMILRGLDLCRHSGS